MKREGRAKARKKRDMRDVSRNEKELLVKFKLAHRLGARSGTSTVSPLDPSLRAASLNQDISACNPPASGFVTL